ncbi:S1 family peptidase [Variovorax sp. 38R]|uniref:S1 family peptidase n=1 Tax=Variovorax sp. 38R TaxID=2774875 RepID=UPI00177FAFA5|nr:serine protease [Variovorax sp. 38R]QOF78040.1 trypsin-like peptidase domain-containing protein [Variovorax sp. 38R]
MRLQLSLFALAAALAAPATFAQDARAGGAPLAPDALFARVSPSVWVVQASDAQGKLLATGSAVVTGPGTAVTSCKLLAKASAVVLRRDNMSYGAVLELPDVERDLCQLRIANLVSPTLGVVPAGALQVGAPLYVIGSPRGRELTLGISMLGGVRRNAAGALESLQLATPTEAGLAGAGLFDAQGRLVGLVGGSAPATLALPAAWIAELPTRGQRALDRLAAQPAPTSLLRPNIVEYQLHDRLTNTHRKVIYRADAATTTDDRLSFNNGGYVEKPGGEVVSVTTAVAGEFDAVMPPGGWARPSLEPDAAWATEYDTTMGGTRIKMDLRASVVDDAATLPFDGRELKVVKINYRGYTQRFANAGAWSGNQFGTYRASVWFSPEVGRVVRFEVQTRGGASGGAFQVSEVLELVSLR